MRSEHEAALSELWHKVEECKEDLIECRRAYFAEYALHPIPFSPVRHNRRQLEFNAWLKLGRETSFYYTKTVFPALNKLATFDLNSVELVHFEKGLKLFELETQFIDFFDFYNHVHWVADLDKFGGLSALEKYDEVVNIAKRLVAEWQISVIINLYSALQPLLNSELITALIKYEKFKKKLISNYCENIEEHFEKNILSQIIENNKNDHYTDFIKHLKKVSLFFAEKIPAFQAKKSWINLTYCNQSQRIFSELIEALHNSIDQQLSNLSKMVISNQNDHSICFDVALFHEFLLNLACRQAECPDEPIEVKIAAREHFLLYAFHFHMRCIDTNNMPDHLHEFAMRALLCVAQMQENSHSKKTACEFLGYHFSFFAANFAASNSILHRSYLQSSLRFFAVYLQNPDVSDKMEMANILQLSITSAQLAGLVCENNEYDRDVFNASITDLQKIIKPALDLKLPDAILVPEQQAFNSVAILAGLEATKTAALPIASDYQNQQRSTLACSTTFFAQDQPASATVTSPFNAPRTSKRKHGL